MFATATMMSGSISFSLDQALGVSSTPHSTPANEVAASKHFARRANIEPGNAVARNGRSRAANKPGRRAGFRGSLTENARCRLMFPVSVCLGIEKRDGSPKIKCSASLLTPPVERTRLLASLRFGRPATKMDGLFQ